MSMISKSVPEISVIIIFLNAGVFLASAIESVLAQTCKDWELLLVDDGSSDDSTEIAKSFAAAYPGVINYHEHQWHANLGTGASRNLGIMHAKGNFVAFLDSDDLWPPNKLERQRAILWDHPEVDVVLGGVHFWGDEPEFSKQYGFHNAEFPVNMVISPRQIYQQMFIAPGGMLFTFGRLLVRKETFHEIGGFESVFRGSGEDAVAWGKMALSHNVYVMDGCALSYRRHFKSIGYQDKNPLIIIDGMIRIISFLIIYATRKPVPIQKWVLPILRESLFNFYIKKAWIYQDTSSKILHFVVRRKQLLQMLFWLSRETNLLTPWRLLRIMVRLFVGQKGCDLLGFY